MTQKVKIETVFDQRLHCKSSERERKWCKKCGGGEQGKLKAAYVMSPRELESVARRVMDESDKKKNESS